MITMGLKWSETIRGNGNELASSHLRRDFLMLVLHIVNILVTMLK